MKTPAAFVLSDPEEALRWLSSSPSELQLSQVGLAEIWGLVAAAVLARKELNAPLVVVDDPASPTARFAQAVGFFSAIEGRGATRRGEPGRTVPLTRVVGFESMDRTAQHIAELLIPAEHEDTRRTVQYVIVELWRNVVQHSEDKLGGIIAAQLNNKGRSAARPTVQVAVGDGGIGIQNHLLRKHPQLTDSQAAIQRALEPHISGTFEEGETGSRENAGMGLFFIAEMTKLVGGRLLVASRGAAFSLAGDPEHEGLNQVRTFPVHASFPGTVVAFEMPAFEQLDYSAMLETIRARARERTPKRQLNKWLVFGEAPEDAQIFLVRLAGEDTQKAAAFSESELVPRIVARKPIGLDFRGIKVSTQSFVHAWLFEALRIAWARKVKIYILNAEPAVRTIIETLENYALGG